MNQRKRIAALAMVGAAIALGIFSGLPMFRLLRQMTGRRTCDDVVAQYGEDVQRRLRPHLTQAGFSSVPVKIALLVFKREQMLELWGKRERQWRRVTTYPFTANSGAIGPKLREGDGQIPEGVYSVAAMNPNSSYHLSLKVNYPNDFDRAMAEADGRETLGGDIYAHGKNLTIGCVPVGDPAIEDLFVLTHAVGMSNAQIIIAPWDFRTDPTRPQFPEIRWSGLLYDMIALALEPYADTTHDIR